LLAQRVEAIVIGGSVLAFNMRGRLVELANQKRIPVVATNAAFAEAGALLTYGASLGDLHRRSALVVDKILKGSRPADIAVEQPTLFPLVINLKAAKALGIVIPQSILLRADRVIE
jgi:putative tryptophan/tyrosine transport system substrate-binding protein